MATPTYDLLDSTTLASDTTSVTFSSIDQSYGDLVLVVEAKFPGNDGLIFELNGDTGKNYPFVTMNGNGTSAASNSNTSSFSNFFVNGYEGTSNIFGVIQILDYSATNKHKPILTRGNDASNVVNVWAQRYANTDAITSVTFADDGGANLLAGSTFYLYGIAK